MTTRKRAADSGGPLFLHVYLRKISDLKAIGHITPERITLVPGWLDNSFAQRLGDAQVARVHERLGLPARYLLYVGGFRLYKAVDQLIEACTLARQTISMDTPVLVSNRASLPEVAPSPQCHFDPEAINEFAAKIQQAVAAPALFRQPPSGTFQEPAGIARFLAALDPLLRNQPALR